MAGARSDSLNVWNGDWSVTTQDNSFLIRAHSEVLQLDLELDRNSPIILNGENGFSIKNPTGSQFSYYYSMPRLSGKGVMVFKQSTYMIADASVWFDHEFFNTASNREGSPQQSSLGEAYIGWDWFALQLENGDNIMIAQVRPDDETRPPYYFGTWSNALGESAYLDESMIELSVLDYWKSYSSKVRYPSKWNIKVPTLSIDVIVEPILNNQELLLSHFNNLKYWEGKSSISGSHIGRAYVELVGYEAE